MGKLVNHCGIIVNSVGDANCLYLQNTGTPIMLDCGVQSKTMLYKKKGNIKKQLELSKKLIISHYHTDHFNALTYIGSNNLQIEELYYPFIPEFQSREKLIKEICFSIYLKNIISTKNAGSCAFNLVLLLKEKNKEKSFKYAPLCCGDTVEQYEVIWPPHNLEGFNVVQLGKGIKKIEEEIKKIPEIARLWSVFDRGGIKDERQMLEIDPTKLEFDKKILENKNIIKDIHFINRNVKSITNRFSICLYKKDNFIFLGDLEKMEIEACLSNFVKTNEDRIFVKYFITPHHGTKNHYSSIISKLIKAEYTISSNGRKHINNYEESYNKISKYHHCTYLNGNFYGMDDVSECVVLSVNIGDLLLNCF